MAFFLSALVFFVWRYRKRRQAETGGTGDAADGSSVSLVKIIPGRPSEKQELDSKEIEVLNSPVPSELQGIRDAAEMPVPHFVAELPGSMPASYQPGMDKTSSTPREDMGQASETGHEVSEPKSAENDGHFRRRSILKGRSLERTVSSPSTPSAGSGWRDVSSVESLESPILR